MKTFRQFIAEQKRDSKINDFVSYACDCLGIKTPPRINLINDKAPAIENKSFGGYYPGQNRIDVNVADRHLADILRTLAHELVHCKQDQDGRFKDVEMAGETGSTFENEANSQAGVMMRNYGRQNPHIYEEFRRP